MKRRTCSLSAALACAGFAAIPALAQYAGPAYENKGVVADPNVPGAVHPWHVGLSTSAGKPIWDDELAGYAAPLAVAGVKMAYGFGQCFGGGMIQDLVALGGSVSGTAATKWSRPAYYREGAGPVSVKPGLGGLPVAADHYYDWVDSYIDGNKGGANHLGAANDGWRFDPFGTNPMTNRGPSETMGTESGQFGQSAAGVALGFTHGAPAANKYAILYSGKPNGIDADQIVSAWNMLTGMYGYLPGNIHVLYGAGAVPVGAPAGMAGRTIAATDANMQATFGALGGLTAVDQLFFLANDHGTAWNKLMGAGRRHYLDVPKTPYQWPGSQGLDQMGPSGWEFLPYYVPAPGVATLLGLAGLTATRRRR